jgi:hypothetical protein
VKFSFRQILASTGGAVIAAIIASTFGVKGTIVGVAIGSAAATIGTVLVAQSIERGHEAVKQVVVKAPDTALLLRRLGGTGAAGDTSGAASTAPTQAMGRTAPTDDGSAGTAETASTASTAAPVGETERLEISAVADAPVTERLQATTRPVPLAGRSAVARPAAARRFSWQAIAAAAVIVFVLALMLITAIELISGKPLSAIFGGSDTGTSVSNLITPTTTPKTTPTTSPSTSSTTSTTSTSSSTTTSSTVPTTTSSTAPAGESTTTTSAAPSQTTTTVTGGVGATTSTTTAP